MAKKLPITLWIGMVLASVIPPLHADLPAFDGVISSREEIKVGRDTRAYTIFRPKDIDPQGSYPLLVAFHGYRGEVKTWFYEESNFGPLIAKDKFIIAYPEAPVSWNPGSNSDDVLFFDDLVASLKKQFPIDPNRVYVIGHSNGAVFASYLLLAKPKTVAAAAAASGLFPANMFPVGVTKSPLMVLWGEKDPMAPAGSDWVQLSIFRYKEKEIPVQTIFTDGGHPWPDSKKNLEAVILAFLFAHPLNSVTAPQK